MCLCKESYQTHESERKGNDSGDVQMVKTERVVAYGENVPRTSNVIISALSSSMRKQVSCHHWKLSKLLVE